MNRTLQYVENNEELFRLWKTKPPHNGINHIDNVFISDGVVCPQRWFSQKVRPLFLLKEAYGGQTDWDLIKNQLLSNGSLTSNATWRRVSQWAYGIINTTAKDICTYREHKDLLRFGNDALQQIAVVNVKKSGGTRQSNDEEIAKYAEYDREELHKQINLIDPTVIVCGYTCNFFSSIVDPKLKVKQNQNLYYTTYINGHSVIVLDYWHPSNHYPDIMNYYGLISIYQQALKEMESHKAQLEK